MRLPFLILFLSLTSFLFSQEKKPVSLSADYFYGSILQHNPDIQHLITEHPKGAMFSYNHKTYGLEEWERRYNFPDWGFSSVYQDMENKSLGQVLSVYGHLNFYFLKRNLFVGVGQGIGFAFNPYDTSKNYNNTAYGSHFLSTTYFKGGFQKENLYKGFGVQAGLLIVHYSNGNIKAPNNSTNTFAFHAGINYRPDYDEMPDFIVKDDSLSRSYAKPVQLTLAVKAGVNESDVIGMGQEPFVVLSAYADKRINYKSSFQAGAEIFFSTFLKELIHYRSIAYPEDGLSGNEDYKRIGVFIGHEWRFNKVAVITNLGYYIYWPFEFENRIYNRLGLKRNFLDDKWFASVTVKAHWAKAEAIEFGVGHRFF